MSVIYRGCNAHVWRALTSTTTIQVWECVNCGEKASCLGADHMSEIRVRVCREETTP